jgi:hypothetical protein
LNILRYLVIFSEPFCIDIVLGLLAPFLRSAASSFGILMLVAVRDMRDI